MLFVNLSIDCYHKWICGAMVARLTPDQKVACSIHVRFTFLRIFLLEVFIRLLEVTIISK